MGYWKSSTQPLPCFSLSRASKHTGPPSERSAPGDADKHPLSGGAGNALGRGGLAESEPMGRSRIKKNGKKVNSHMPLDETWLARIANRFIEAVDEMRSVAVQDKIDHSDPAFALRSLSKESFSDAMGVTRYFAGLPATIERFPNDPCATAAKQELEQMLDRIVEKQGTAQDFGKLMDIFAAVSEQTSQDAETPEKEARRRAATKKRIRATEKDRLGIFFFGSFSL